MALWNGFSGNFIEFNAIDIDKAFDNVDTLLSGETDYVKLLDANAFIKITGRVQ